MSQIASEGAIVAVLMVSYLFSSWTAAGLFTYAWVVSHRDRTGLEDVPDTDRRIRRLRKAAAWRNEYIGGSMALAALFTAVAATLILIRIFEVIYLPWEPGLATFFFLAAANLVEMTVAVVILFTRIQMNREGD
jgi:hypothetical protein